MIINKELFILMSHLSILKILVVNKLILKDAFITKLNLLTTSM